MIHYGQQIRNNGVHTGDELHTNPSLIGIDYTIGSKKSEFSSHKKVSWEMAHRPSGVIPYDSTYSSTILYW